MNNPFDFDFNQQDTEITMANRNGHIILSNGCRVKIVDGRETLPIKERFGIDKWARLANSLNQEQINQLWFSYKSSARKPTSLGVG